MKKRNAFTLAEVLITLGIIGIVAAMTMPTLIQKNNNRVVETRLMKFYSAMNQAILMAEKDYGDKKIWYQDLAGAAFDDDGNPVPGSSEQEKWFNKYIAPYMKITKSKILSDGSFVVYFPDGSALRSVSTNTRDWIFYPGALERCINTSDYSNTNGICSFSFTFNPEPGADIQYWLYHYNKGFEPWKWQWDGTRQALLDGCNGQGAGSRGKQYCTALIQYNGWKIPDDYPYKVSY